MWRGKLPFCSICGSPVDATNGYCSNCGNRLGDAGWTVGGESKEYVLLLENVISDSYSSGVYELYVTKNRLVFLKMRPRTNAMAAGGGLVGALIVAGVDRARKKNYAENLTLDQKVELDEHNYVIPFENISQISRRKSRLGGWKEVEITFTNENGKSNSPRYQFGNQVKTFVKAISSLPGIQEKIDSSIHESIAGTS